MAATIAQKLDLPSAEQLIAAADVAFDNMERMNGSKKASIGSAVERVGVKVVAKFSPSTELSLNNARTA
ncbi:hypothetical protein [Corynebacterium pelargi]|uniref:Uncharacterized protein n=1 Tax=Corynebacterium pelargi TaxID=1471400 RepID=A0A410W6R5_9CORY|nr:hypothetical protein [Corynebacterium pelargi]QAU51731.1 hypothetical protein CPELA_02165 [Corynebacterium pelargi]GGG80840.1 hypothetical protein GCM10007338_19270 [Corynebacterium pelargi]